MDHGILATGAWRNHPTPQQEDELVELGERATGELEWERDFGTAAPATKPKGGEQMDPEQDQDRYEDPDDGYGIPPWIDGSA